MAKSFLRVFGPKSEQIHVYRSVVEPLLEEVNLIALPSISCRVHCIPYWMICYSTTRRIRIFLILFRLFILSCILHEGDAWLQLHSVCLWPDRIGEDLHHGGQACQQEQGRCLGCWSYCWDCAKVSSFDHMAILHLINQKVCIYLQGSWADVWQVEQCRAGGGRRVCCKGPTEKNI